MIKMQIIRMTFPPRNCSFCDTIYKLIGWEGFPEVKLFPSVNLGMQLISSLICIVSVGSTQQRNNRVDGLTGSCE